MNRIHQLKSGWALRIKSNDFNATAMLTGNEGPTHLMEGWETTIIGSDMNMLGWASGAKRSVPIRGRGVLIHHKGPELPTSNRTLLFASGDGWVLGVDHHPPKQLAWGKWGDLDLLDDTIEIEYMAHGLTIRAESWSATFAAEERLSLIHI